MALLGTFIAIIPHGGGRHVIFLTSPRMFAIVRLSLPSLFFLHPYPLTDMFNCS